LFFVVENGLTNNKFKVFFLERITYSMLGEEEKHKRLILRRRIIITGRDR